MSAPQEREPVSPRNQPASALTPRPLRLLLVGRVKPGAEPGLRAIQAQFPVAVAEEANTLETVLVEIADGIEKRTSRQLELFVRLLEPVMLLVMAGVTLVVVMGLLLPVFRMGSAVR